MRRRLSATLRVLVAAAVVGAATAQAQSPELQARPVEDQAVDLFVQNCVGLTGYVNKLRELMPQKGARELSPAQKKQFVRGSDAVGFDMSNGAAHMLLVSRSDGWCTVYAEAADKERLAPLLTDAATKAGLELTDKGTMGKSPMTTQGFQTAINGYQYMITVSVGEGRSGPPHLAILTIAHLVDPTGRLK